MKASELIAKLRQLPTDAFVSCDSFNPARSLVYCSERNQCYLTPAVPEAAKASKKPGCPGDRFL